MGRQMRQNVVDFLLHSLEIYGALYLFYTALCAALDICGFGICGFDYSWMQKTANNEGKLLFLANLGFKRRFCYSLFDIFQERKPPE
jgi:hypothetical protein